MMKKAIQKSILLVDNDEPFRRSLENSLKKKHRVWVAESAEKALNILAEKIPDLILLAIMLPKMDGIELLKHIKANCPNLPVMMITDALDQMPKIVESKQQGAFDYLTKPTIAEEIFLKIDQALESSACKIKQELDQRREWQFMINTNHRLIGSSSALEKIRKQIRVVADSGSTVLIEGETGTGKELVARAIHACNSRAGGPFVAINCGAIPKELMEAEFFGHAKGAFTGAHTARIGKFQLANHGTLLLDEIGELSPEAQTKLLRVLEEQEFYPVGGAKLIKVDVRVIASTNKNLKERVDQGGFREDLFFRLNVYSFRIPPLREHPEDILPLAEYFIERFNLKFKKNFQSISPEAQEILVRHPWRGNVRNLRNLIERVVLSDEGPVITKAHVEFIESTSPVKLQGRDAFQLPASGINFEELEKRFMLQALERAEGNKTKAANLLKLSRPTFLYRLKKHGLT